MVSNSPAGHPHCYPGYGYLFRRLLETYVDAYVTAPGRTRVSVISDFGRPWAQAFVLGPDEPAGRAAHDRQTRPRGRDHHEARMPSGITVYLLNGGLLEYAQQMAAHDSPRTTMLYDRTSDEITLDEVERISI